MKFKIKDPGSAITHFIACVMAVLAAAPLLLKAAREPDKIHLIAMSIFILSMILLYAASTIYHTVDSTEKVNRRLRKMDHIMIFFLIAGSYCTSWKNRNDSLYCGMVSSNSWNDCEGMLDYLSKMVFFCDLYCNGLVVCICFYSDCKSTQSGRIWLAVGRWNHLYCWWSDLCTQSTVI